MNITRSTTASRRAERVRNMRWVYVSSVIVERKDENGVARKVAVTKEGTYYTAAGRAKLEAKQARIAYRRARRAAEKTAAAVAANA